MPVKHLLKNPPLVLKDELDQLAKAPLWDKVRDCIGKKCPIYRTCPFRATVDTRISKYIDPETYRLPEGYEKYTDTFGRKFDPDLHEVDLETMAPRLIQIKSRFPGKGFFLSLVRRPATNPNTLGPCLVERRYMQTICQPLVRLMEQANDPFVNHLVGLHLVPRYLDLLHLKMERLAHPRAVMVGKKVNPVFREIRIASDAILRLWRTSGLLDIARKVGFFQIGGKILPDDLDLEMEAGFEEGTPGAYEQMSEGS